MPSRTYAVEDVGKIPLLKIDVETGDPSKARDSSYVQIGLTYDEPYLDNYCPPGTCEHDGKLCSHDGRWRYTRIPPMSPSPAGGDLVLSPGTGRG